MARMIEVTEVDFSNPNGSGVKKHINADDIRELIDSPGGSGGQAEIQFKSTNPPMTVKESREVLAERIKRS